MKISILMCTAALGTVLSGAALADDSMGGMKMDNMGDMGAAPQKAVTAQGIGVVKAVDADKGMVTLAHQPIKEMHWPAMTMSFKVADATQLKGIAAGQHVHFTLQGSGMNCVVTSIKADQ